MSALGRREETFCCPGCVTSDSANMSFICDLQRLTIKITVSDQNYQRNHVEVDELRGRQRKHVKKKRATGDNSFVK